MARIGNFCWIVHCYVGSEEGNKTCSQSSLSRSVTTDVQHKDQSLQPSAALRKNEQRHATGALPQGRFPGVH